MNLPDFFTDKDELLNYNFSQLKDLVNTDIDHSTIIENLSPLVKKELLGSAQDVTPSPMNYSILEESSSMYNTPPTFSWYVAGKVFRWLKGKGGLKAIGQINQRKAKKLYDFIDKSDLYTNKIQESSRSIMNIPFLLEKEDLNNKFLSDSSNNGLLALKGHRSVGGMRASIYNAMPEEGVDSLIEFMKLFEQENL